MVTRNVKFNSEGIEKLPVNKPVTYVIQTPAGNPNFVGSAKRGETQKRISRHLGRIPGASVKVQQFSSIADAQKSETRLIDNKQPKYNKGRRSR